MSDTKASDFVTANARSLHAYEATLLESPRSTIENAPLSAEPGADLLQVSKALRFETLLGQGAMGTVHLARQLSLGRQVAVKQLAERLRHNQLYAHALLREAWVLAALEHPNIPPLHDVIMDDDGLPLLLLKRIEGDEWAKLMKDGSAVDKRFGEDPLVWNLEVLDNICNAVSYAHSRRIIHRDLKPENVMIGAFGEVYVVDWGIAVTLDKDPEGRLPFIGDTTQPAGTPAFMAPELLSTDASQVDERTDVYLIGGMLCELITGSPPHQGKDMATMVRSILKSDPQFPDDAPAGLVAIARKAMRSDPAERFSSVEEMRVSLRKYLRRRSSQQLTAQGYDRLASLHKLTAHNASGGAPPDLASIYGECRFAFRQALVSFPDSHQARQGLTEAAELMARNALAAGLSESALSFLEEAENPDPLLMQEAQVLSNRSLDRLARLEALEKQQDPSLGRSKFVRIGLPLVVGVTIAAIVAQKTRGTWLDHHLTFILWQTFLLGAFLKTYHYLELETTVHNRLVYVLFTANLAAGVLATAGGWLAGMSPIDTVLLISIGWVTIGLAAVLAGGIHYLPLAISGTLAMVAIALYPDLAHLVTALQVFAVMAWLAVIDRFDLKPRSFLEKD